MSELLLSATLSTCALPTSTLHSLQTGSLLFSFKSPNLSSSSTASNPHQAAAENAANALTGIGLRKSMGFVAGNDATGGAIIGLGGKEGRAGINVWGFQKVSHPPPSALLLAPAQPILTDCIFPGASSATLNSSRSPLHPLPLQHRPLLGWWNLRRSYIPLGGSYIPIRCSLRNSKFSIAGRFRDAAIDHRRSLPTDISPRVLTRRFGPRQWRRRRRSQHLVAWSVRFSPSLAVLYDGLI